MSFLHPRMPVKKAYMLHQSVVARSASVRSLRKRECETTAFVIEIRGCWTTRSCKGGVHLCPRERVCVCVCLGARARMCVRVRGCAGLQALEACLLQCRTWKRRIEWLAKEIGQLADGFQGEPGEGGAVLQPVLSRGRHCHAKDAG